MIYSNVAELPAAFYTTIRTDALQQKTCHAVGNILIDVKAQNIWKGMQYSVVAWKQKKKALRSSLKKVLSVSAVAQRDFLKLERGQRAAAGEERRSGKLGEETELVHPNRRRAMHN